MAKRKRRKRRKPRLPVSQNSQVNYQQGFRFFAMEDYPAAIRLWRNELRRAPDEKMARMLGEAHFRYALSLNRTRKLAQVISELHQAIQRVPDMAIYHYHLGLAYHLKGDASRAAAAYRQALELEPANERFQKHLDLVLFESSGGSEKEENSIWQLIQVGRYAEAVEQLEQEPEQGMTFLLFGVLAALLRNYVPAKRALNRCDRTEYASIAAHYLGSIYAEEGKFPSAIKFLEKAVRDPQFAEKDTPLLVAVYTQQAQRYVEKGQPAKANQLWNKLARLDPYNPAATNAVAAVLEEGYQHAVSDDFASAMRIWRRVINQGIEHPVLLQNYAIACDRNERYVEAHNAWEKLAEIWEEALPAGSRDSVAHKKVGLVYRRIGEVSAHFGDFGSMREAYEKALRYLPQDIDITIRLCAIKAEMGDFRSALSDLKRLERDYPDNLVVLRAIVALYLNEDRFDQAIDAAIRLLKVDPNQEPARELLRDLGYDHAQVLAENRSTRQAHCLLDKLIAADPEFPSYQYLKMRLLFRDHRLPEAHQVFDHMVQLTGEKELAYARFGFLCMQAGLHGQAKQHFRTAGGVDCPSAIGLALMAAAHLTFNEALADRYFEAFGMHPEASPDVLMDILHNWVELKRGDLAVKILERGLELYPNSYDLAYSLILVGTVNRGSGSLEKALDRVLPLLERSNDPEVRQLVQTLRMMRMLGQTFGHSLPEMLEGIFFDEFDEFDEDDEPF